MLKKYLRKKLHLRFVNKYIADTRWYIINTVITASVTEYNEAITDHLDNLGKLVRK